MYTIFFGVFHNYTHLRGRIFTSQGKLIFKYKLYMESSVDKCKDVLRNKEYSTLQYYVQSTVVMILTWRSLLNLIMSNLMENVTPVKICKISAIYIIISSTNLYILLKSLKIISSQVLNETKLKNKMNGNMLHYFKRFQLQLPGAGRFSINVFINAAAAKLAYGCHSTFFVPSR